MVTIDDQFKQAIPGDEFYIEKGQVHRVQAINGTVYILEIAFGEFNEEDIERKDDAPVLFVA